MSLRDDILYCLKYGTIMTAAEATQACRDIFVYPKGQPKLSSVSSQLYRMFRKGELCRVVRYGERGGYGYCRPHPGQSDAVRSGHRDPIDTDDYGDDALLEAKRRADIELRTLRTSDGPSFFERPPCSWCDEYHVSPGCTNRPG